MKQELLEKGATWCPMGKVLWSQFGAAFGIVAVARLNGGHPIAHLFEFQSGKWHLRLSLSKFYAKDLALVVNDFEAWRGI